MKLTRRQFSGSVLSGAFASLRHVSAQPRDTIVVGVEHGDIIRNTGGNSNPISAAIEDYSTLPGGTTHASAFQALAVKYVNLRSLQTASSVVNLPLLSPSDRISGVTYLADGTLFVVITPDSGGANGGAPPQFVFINDTVRILPASGLSIDAALDSVLLLKKGTLIGMVTKKDGTGPAHIVEVNPVTGVVTFTNPVGLPTDRRFSCLAEAPDGTIYSSVFRANATTELWKLDLTNKTATFLMPLTTFDGMAGKVPWYHGIQSLIVTPAGQLVALCNLEYRLPDSIYLIDLATGFMKEVTGFAVSRAALVTPGAKKV